MKLFPIAKCSGVYLLICKRTGKTYIGASGNVFKRVKVHRRKRRYDAFIIQKAPNKHLPVLERKWILKLKPDLNQKLYCASAGIKRRPETLKKMSAWQKGVKKGPMPWLSAKLSKALKGIKKTEEHRLKAAAARKAVGNKPWTKAQWKAHEGMWTPALRKRLSRAMKGKPWSKARREACERNKK